MSEDEHRALWVEVHAIKSGAASMEKALAVMAADRDHMDDRFNRIERSFDSMAKKMEANREADAAAREQMRSEFRSVFARFGWLVGGIVVAGVLNFILAGGLAQVPGK